MTMLNAKILSSFFRKKLEFFKTNPAATIAAGWCEDDYELYVSYSGDAFWAHRQNDDELPPLVIWNPSNFSVSRSLVGEDAHRFFLERLRHFTADHFARRGYSHPAVMWAVFNLLDDDGNIVGDENWFITPEPVDEVPHAERYAAELRYRKEQIALRAEMRAWAIAHGVQTVRRVDYENHAGVHGYVEYNLLDGTYSGYKVWCYSSHHFGGNCACVNHDPGEEISGEMSRYDFEEARKEYFRQNSVIAE